MAPSRLSSRRLAIAAGEKEFNPTHFTRKLLNRTVPALLFATIFSGAAFSQDKAFKVATPGPDRLEQFVEANVTAVHANQILLARQQHNVDPACWPASDPAEGALKELVEHQTALLSSPAIARMWALGAFDPAKVLQPLLAAKLPMPANLPVNVFTAYLHERAPRHRNEEIRSIANLYQTVLEVERDGDRLQDLYAFYIALGLPVYVAQLGLPGGDDDFLATGRLLEGRSCSSPFGLSATDWQIASRKIWNWGEKNADLRTMGMGFNAAGARVVMFDDVHDPSSADPKMLEKEADAARQAGIEIVKVRPILAASRIAAVSFASITFT
jgi:hypothetical protein